MDKNPYSRWRHPLDHIQWENLRKANRDLRELRFELTAPEKEHLIPDIAGRVTAVTSMYEECLKRLAEADVQKIIAGQMAKAHAAATSGAVAGAVPAAAGQNLTAQGIQQGAQFAREYVDGVSKQISGLVADGQALVEKSKKVEDVPGLRTFVLDASYFFRGTLADIPFLFRSNVFLYAEVKNKATGAVQMVNAGEYEVILSVFKSLLDEIGRICESADQQLVAWSKSVEEMRKPTLDYLVSKNNLTNSSLTIVIQVLLAVIAFGSSYVFTHAKDYWTTKEDLDGARSLIRTMQKQVQDLSSAVSAKDGELQKDAADLKRLSEERADLAQKLAQAEFELSIARRQCKPSQP